MLGAAVTAYDGSSDDITDPEIGEVKFIRKQWGDKPFGFEEIATVPCSDTDFFGASGEGDLEDAAFLPIKKEMKQTYKTYGSKLLCPKDLDDIQIKGNYDTSEGSNLMIVFEKCDPVLRAKAGLKCKTENQIEEWLQFKYILIIENGIQFVEHKFEGERIEANSAITWYPLASKGRIDIVRMITRSDMMLNDHVYRIGDIFAENH